MQGRALLQHYTLRPILPLVPTKTWHIARMLQPLAENSVHLICFYPPRKPCSIACLRIGLLRGLAIAAIEM